MVLFPNCNKIQDLIGQVSPCIIEVMVCGHIEVESDPQKLVLLIWEFEIKDSLHSSGMVNPLFDYDEEDPYPTMPWLNVRNTHCNCSKYPLRGEILQNNSADRLPDDLPEQGAVGNPSVHHNDNEESDGGETPEEDNIQATTSSEYLYTETFKLKGTSFHNHFQDALRKYKHSQLNDSEPSLKLLLEPVNKRDENAIVVVAKFDN